MSFQSRFAEIGREFDGMLAEHAAERARLSAELVAARKRIRELESATRPAVDCAPGYGPADTFVRTMQSGDRLREGGTLRWYEIVAIGDDGTKALAKEAGTNRTVWIDADWEMHDANDERVYLPCAVRAANEEAAQ